MSENNEYTLIFSIFSIVIFEFKHNIYNELVDYEYKLEQLLPRLTGSDKVFTKVNTAIKRGEFINEVIQHIDKLALKSDIADKYENYNEYSTGTRDNSILYILFWMTPTDIEAIECPSFSITSNKADAKDALYHYINNFKLSSDKFLYNFCYFLLEHLHKSDIDFNICVNDLLITVGKYA